MSCRDSDNSDNSVLDGLFNYVLHEEIGRSTVSVVIRATCRRGRLRNRQVAIKKMSSQSTEKKAVAVAALHSSLCHPTIISLISSFQSPCGLYHVLELCENGDLAQFLSYRDGKALVEGELRGVAKALIDALIYLKKERVLHRDIKLSNILLAGDFRVKLSGFSSAIRLPTIDAFETGFYGSANYISPEILSGQPYNFGADMWSLGCVFMTCLSGEPPFHASTPEHVFDNICRVTYTLPDTASYDVRDFTSGLLQKRPEDRTPLHRLLSHPFLNPSLPVIPLSSERLLSSEQTPKVADDDSAPSARRYPPSLSVNPTRTRPTSTKHQPAKHTIMSKRTPLEDITNFYQEDSLGNMALLRDPLYVTAPTGAGIRDFGLATRLDNVYDNEIRPPTPTLTSDSGTGTMSSIATAQGWAATTALPPRNRSTGEHATATVSPRAKLKRVLSDPCGSADPLSETNTRSVMHPALRINSLPRLSSKALSSTAVSRSPISADQLNARVTGLTKQNACAMSPIFNTCRLKSQTHKISRGQLVVLPSKSLLVDFREGERRRGRKGKEVLVISPDGSIIEVYDAPHLSSPCCLSEPIARYGLEQLPSEYAHLYEDAASLVDRLNARVHKLVYYWDDAKGILMANGPPGDIELHMPKESNDEQENIRVRVFRGRRSVEISRYMVSKKKQNGEWTKKVLPLTSSLESGEDDWLSLDGLERSCMERVSDFLRICESAEVVEGARGSPVRAREKEKEGRDGRQRLEQALSQIGTQSQDGAGGLNNGFAPGSTSIASSVVVRPRPQRLNPSCRRGLD